jgi:hypothetical protein
VANSKISALTSATTPLAGTETLPVVQSGATKQVSVANLTAGRSVGAGHININTSTEFGLLNVSSTGANDTLATFGDFSTPGNSVGIYGRVNGSGVFSIKTAGVAIRLSSDAALGNPVDILDGNVIPKTAAKGINFTANTPASGMTSQLLNWYEEGTWTPNQGAGLTVVGTFSSSGKYTRIGRQVTLVAYVVGSVSIAAAAGNYICTNTPFASSFLTPGTTMNGNGTFGGNLYLATSSIVAVEAIASTSTIYFTVTYFV